MLSSQEVCDSSSVATNESLPASSSFCLVADGHDQLLRVLLDNAILTLTPSFTISPLDNAIFNRLVPDNAILSPLFESWKINLAAFAYACHL